MTIANKRVQVSADLSTWYTLPGNTGQLTNQAGTVDDTIFGQAWKSMQPTSIDGKVTANAFFKGFAGYVCTLKKTGTPTTMTAEACTVVSGKTYKITNAAHNCIDPNTALVVLDNAVDHTADVLSIDYLFGRVTFKSAYTPTTPVTLTGKYLPISTLTKVNSFTLTQNATAVDSSDFDTLQTNSGHKTFICGLKTVSLDTKGFYDSTNGVEAALDARQLLMVEINPDGSSQSVFRGFFRYSSDQKAGNVGAIETADLKFDLSVPDDVDGLLAYPAAWLHTATTLPLALQTALTQWESDLTIGMRYLPDGAAGFEADVCVITDISLSSGVDAMNTFSIGLQISGNTVAYP